MVVKKQSIDECMKKDDNPQNLIYKDITTDEICTIMMAKKLKGKNLGSFDEKNYITGLKDNEKKDILSFEQNMKTVKICDVKSGKIAYDNCALVKENPYITTYNDNGEYYCSFMQNIFEKNINNVANSSKNKIYTDTIIDSKKEKQHVLVMPKSDIYVKKEKKAFCECRWQDIFCIPNYHLGNEWYKYTPNKDADTPSIGKCYKPCPVGYIPAPKSTMFGGSLGDDACIINRGQFSYLPIALICLLGTTYNVFQKDSGYIAYLESYRKLINDTVEHLIKKNVQGEEKDIIFALTKYIKDTANENTNTIWMNVKGDLNKYINDIFDAYTINDNFINKLYNKKSDFDQYNEVEYEKLFLYAYDIAKNIHTLQNAPDKDAYREWRNKLQSISNLEESKFSYLLQMLKKACNVCFDGITYPSFSKDYVLFYLKGKYGEARTFNEFFIKIDEDPKSDYNELPDFRFKRKKIVGLYDNIENGLSSHKGTIDILLHIFAYVCFLIILYLILLYFYETFIYMFINLPLTVLYIVFYKFFGYYISCLFYYIFDTYKFYIYVRKINLDILQEKYDHIDAIIFKINNKYLHK